MAIGIPFAHLSKFFLFHSYHTHTLFSVAIFYGMSLRTAPICSEVLRYLVNRFQFFGSSKLDRKLEMLIDQPALVFRHFGYSVSNVI